MTEFERNGVRVLRGLILKSMARAWAQTEEERIYSRTVNRFNPVDVGGQVGAPLASAASHPGLLKAVREALGAEPHVYNFRLVVKDKHSEAAVFLHQDVGYHIGSMPKLSAFIALSEVNQANGGMIFWLGTHKYGYLGDVGEIDRKHLKDAACICPSLRPGDVVLMHSALWHESGPRLAGPDRIMADIIFQRADDPARLLPREGLFVRSRVTRLKELQKDSDALALLRATS